MLVVRTTENPANPVGKLVSAQEIVRLDHFALAVNPFGLNRIQPRALLGQKTTYDPDPTPTVFDVAVVLVESSPDLFGDVPARVVPDEK